MKKLFHCLAPNNTLQSNQALGSGQSLTSSNKCFKLTLQRNGVIVLRKVSNNLVLWTSTLLPTPGAQVLMTGDGNLYLLDELRNYYFWASGTGGNNGAVLVLQDSGNLVITATAGTVVWTTNTATAC